MEDYLIHTRESFDKIADSFDREDYSNEILQWMRSEVYEIYSHYFKEGDTLLELNAGTGIDAIALASRGIKVFATDISGRMINNLRTKIRKENLDNFIKTDILPFDDISRLNESNFDGAISNFGGLNCINNFYNLSKDLADKIKPGGRFVASVMNSFCPWEILYFLSKGKPSEAFRRFRNNGIEANLSQHKIKSFYFSPKEFASQYKEHFELERISSLGLFTPPPYLYGIYYKAKFLVKLFMKTDHLIKGIFPFNRIGDHFIIVLKRKLRDRI